jgi:hypothetical protein
MFMRVSKRILLIIIALLAATGMPARALEQALPPGSWYAVVWNAASDTLHWVNAAGEQAALARPKVPGEAADSAPAVQVSRNGRYLLEAATLETRVRAVGIYDLQAGQFVGVHQAAPGEAISLGKVHTSSLTSQRMAVGLASTDPANPSWRVLVFDTTTGGAVAQITSVELRLTGMDAYRMPIVVYYDIDEGSGQEVVHFQLLPINAGVPAVVEAYAWYISTGTITVSPYDQIDVDIQYGSGEMALALHDPNFSALEAPPMLGISYNAVGRGFADNALTTVWADGTHYHYTPRWAAGGQWLLYLAQGEALDDNWNVVLAGGTPADNQQIALGPNVQRVWGTPDGYLALDDAGALLFMNQFEVEASAASFGVPVFQIPDAQQADVIYVSDTGAFALPAVAEPGAAVVAAPDDMAVAQVGCEGAPRIRLAVGMTARVVFANGLPLRVRTAPGGEIVTQIPEGTVFSILAGPQCRGSFAWWQIRTTDGIEGWSAEGGGNGYFVEPYIPPADALVALASVTPTAPPVIMEPPSPTPTPPTPAAVLPTSTPMPVLAGAALDDSCGLAPAIRLAPQMHARTNTPDGTLALRLGPADEYPSNQIPHHSEVTILGDSRCQSGYRMWPVAVPLNGMIVVGWVSEGTQQQYFLEPLP